MIGGGIVGLLVAPLPLITSAAALAGPAGVAAGIIGGIMWQVGLALGPMNIAGAEKDPREFFPTAMEYWQCPQHLHTGCPKSIFHDIVSRHC